MIRVLGGTRRWFLQAYSHRLRVTVSEKCRSTTSTTIADFMIAIERRKRFDRCLALSRKQVDNCRWRKIAALNTAAAAAAFIARHVSYYVRLGQAALKHGGQTYRRLLLAFTSTQDIRFNSWMRRNTPPRRRCDASIIWIMHGDLLKLACFWGEFKLKERREREREKALILLCFSRRI